MTEKNEKKQNGTEITDEAPPVVSKNARGVYTDADGLKRRESKTSSVDPIEFTCIVYDARAIEYLKKGLSDSGLTIDKFGSSDYTYKILKSLGIE